jgi:hypothetical protein
MICKQSTEPSELVNLVMSRCSGYWVQVPLKN